MAASGRRPSRTASKLLSWLRHSWRGIALRILRWLLIFVLAVEVLAGFSGSDIVRRLNACFVVALCCVSLAYLHYVSSRVQLDLPGIGEHIMGPEGDAVSDDTKGARRGVTGRFALWARRKAALRKGRQDDLLTLRVPRLSTEAARVDIANGARLPVLRAQTSIVLAYVPEDVDEDEADGEGTGGSKARGTGAPTRESVRRFGGEPFSIPARSTLPTTLTNTFDHVGIFRLRSAGVRIYSLLGLFSRVCGSTGHWRVCVVPNVYRLQLGVLRQRKVAQTSLGIPRTPADALDYDRVRDYRPGDPLKTIHWKLVAHRQGELYTKLFETPTISSVTLLIDPYGPDARTSFSDAAFHLYDTLLEGGFSLIEHARENGVMGHLRFVSRTGSLLEADWPGPAILAWFVETAARPSTTPEARLQSIRAIQSLQRRQDGYAIVATGELTDQSVEELITCHLAGVALLVVHALPSPSSPEYKTQRFYDSFLREASIAVISLSDGPQIVREVTLS